MINSELDIIHCAPIFCIVLFSAHRSELAKMTVKYCINLQLPLEEYRLLPEPLKTNRSAGGGRCGFIRAAIREKAARDAMKRAQQNEVRDGEK